MITHKILNANWEFRECTKSEWMTAKVPGTVHMDLFRNGQIADPFFGTNEYNLQWIDKLDWEYRTSFDASPELMKHRNVELVFEGLDTYADVYLNGCSILSANNMFRTWRTNVRAFIRPEGNELVVRFRSPIITDQQKLESLGYGLPAINDHSEDGGVGESKLSVFARKAPYHYGWDWGPRFVTSGIWKEVRLEGWSGIRIVDLYVRQKNIQNNSAELTAEVTLEVEEDWTGQLQVSTEELVSTSQVQVNSGIHRMELDMNIASPRLWWCRGYGEPNLYEFQARLTQGDAKIAHRLVRTGLRKVRLVRENDRHGASFYFELNGVPVFAKGANHIPNDSFVTEVSRDRYQHEIQSAVLSNMNMLRVWGGGIYEHQTFYELCDEHGLLVWQDFMFACSMYPGDEAFLHNVRIEAEENLIRLRNHPCIALWCGNNEIDTAWSHYKENSGWGWKEKYPAELREKIWSDYERIFHDILPAAVQRHGAGIDYWPSSPMVEQTGDGGQHSHYESAAGDIHYWGVWHASEPFDNYDVYVGRFMSEYGFQSFPELKSLEMFSEHKDWELYSEVMLAHQKNNQGNRLINEYMDRYMKQPKDFNAFLYMSQVLQAEAMRVATEAHRRKMPYCMGTLYWQMNDCWPVASWSSMDYYGRWKAAQYYIKDSFKDVLLSFEPSGEDGWLIKIVSDLPESFSGTLTLSVRDFAGRVMKQLDCPVDVASRQVTEVCTLSKTALLEGLDPALHVLYGTLSDSRLHEWAMKTMYFVSNKELQLSVPCITIREIEGATFVIETDSLAKQVWLTTEIEGVFSDNYFDLLPGLPKRVTFMKRGELNKKSHPDTITARSMADFCIHDPSDTMNV